MGLATVLEIDVDESFPDRVGGVLEIRRKREIVGVGLAPQRNPKDMEGAADDRSILRWPDGRGISGSVLEFLRSDADQLEAVDDQRVLERSNCKRGLVVSGVDRPAERAAATRIFSGVISS
ncbi:hypothetical protein [Natrinema saccharevitans]|uniref:hypothetical protein n=1 Tax=Natrinema saccharevitans TaxID=301967 RepID=UPI00111574E0|nr:hypothetical protein [Natrinema saccharevitans]